MLRLFITAILSILFLFIQPQGCNNCNEYYDQDVIAETSQHALLKTRSVVLGNCQKQYACLSDGIRQIGFSSAGSYSGMWSNIQTIYTAIWHVSVDVHIQGNERVYQLNPFSQKTFPAHTTVVNIVLWK